MLSNAVCEKTMENLKKRDNKLLTNETKRNYLVSEPNFHSKKISRRYTYIPE